MVLGGNMEFMYYLDKKDLKLYGYGSDEVAREFHDNYDNLILLDEETSDEYRFNKPRGGKWVIGEGWVVDEELLKEEQKAELENQLQELQRQIQDLNIRIQEHLLFGEKEEAKEVVLEKRKLEEELHGLESKINS